MSWTPDPVDRALIRLTQTGLPLVPRPYHALAEQLAIPAAEVMDRFRHMVDCGAIRRMGAIPNHYALGYAANGMTVWDVDDDHVATLGPKVGALDFVTHCYRRPRHLPDWPYNLFAMAHGADRSVVAAKAAQIAEMLGEHCRGHKILYSTRILKKTGLRG